MAQAGRATLLVGCPLGQSQYWKWLDRNGSLWPASKRYRLPKQYDTHRPYRLYHSTVQYQIQSTGLSESKIFEPVTYLQHHIAFYEAAGINKFHPGNEKIFPALWTGIRQLSKRRHGTQYPKIFVLLSIMILPLTFSSFLLDYTIQSQLKGIGILNLTIGIQRRSLFAIFKFQVPKSTIMNIGWRIFKISKQDPRKYEHWPDEDTGTFEGIKTMQEVENDRWPGINLN